MKNDYKTIDYRVINSDKHRQFSAFISLKNHQKLHMVWFFLLSSSSSSSSSLSLDPPSNCLNTTKLSFKKVEQFR